MKYTFVSLVLALLLICTSMVFARNYSITTTSSKLPSSRAYSRAAYDGVDIIYIAGGLGPGSDIKELVKYNITADTIEILAPASGPNKYADPVWNPTDQSIYYIGGLSPDLIDSPAIWKVQLNDPETLVPSGSLPIGAYMSSPVWNHGEYIYVFGGYQFTSSTYLDTIVRFSTRSNQTELISRAPLPLAGASVIWDPAHSVAYTFGGIRSSVDILMFNETSGGVSRVDTSLPYSIYYTCAVLVGQEVFIIGGFGDGPANEFSFLKFDLETKEITSLLIDNFPYYMYGVGCTYVENLNRIYIFGGVADYDFQDTIMYIDMN